MQRIYAFITLLTAATLSVLPVTTNAADDDLDVTMQVIDDLSEIDGDLVGGMARARVPDESGYDEDASDAVNGDDERRLVDQLIEMDGEFAISSGNDGFEHDGEPRRDHDSFVGEDNFEEGEDVDEPESRIDSKATDGHAKD